MRGHVLLAIEAIGTMAGSIDFANNALTYQGCERSCARSFIHRLDNANKFVAQHALKPHVTVHNLQVGVANARQQDTYESFALDQFRLWIVIIECKSVVLVNKGAHRNTSPFSI